MKRMYVFVFSLMSFIYSYGQSYSDGNIETELEEKFVYGVSWSFFRLGSITITVEKILSDPDLKKITVDIKSAPLLPFVDIDKHNELIMNVISGMTIDYYSIEKLDGEKVELTCRYQQESGLTIYEEFNVASKVVIKNDTLSFDKPYIIGSSLPHYIRLIADSGLVKNVPTMLGGSFYNSQIKYSKAVEFIEIDNFDEPIRTLSFDVSADWDGNATAGLSGEFVGWISDDDEAVIIRTEMEIFLGSINVELEEWHKPGWFHPTESDNLITKKNNY